MRNRYPAILAVAALLLSAGLPVYAEKAPAIEEDEATIDRLNSLDNRVKLLQKKLEVKKLEDKLRKIGKPENPAASFPTSVRKVLSSQSGVKKVKKLMRKLPQDFITSSRPDLTRNKKVKNLKKAEKEKKEKERRESFEKRIARSRVTSVTGFGDDLQAEIRFPDGGRLTVREGREYGRIGTVAEISLNNVAVRKFGRRYFVPYGRPEDSKSSLSGGRDGRR